AADRHDDARQVRDLFQQLEPDGALAGNDEVVIEGVHHGEPLFGFEPARLDHCVRDGRAGQHDPRAVAPRVGELDQRCALRHHDGGGDAEPLAMVGHRLRVVAGAGRDDAAPPLLRREREQAVQRATVLERARALEVLQLDAQAAGHDIRERQRGRARREHDAAADPVPGGVDVGERGHRRNKVGRLTRLRESPLPPTVARAEYREHRGSLWRRAGAGGRERGRVLLVRAGTNRLTQDSRQPLSVPGSSSTVRQVTVRITELTAAAIAGEVRAGRMSPTDTVRAALERIAEVDERVGAFARVRAEAALAEAEALARREDLSALPLAGVPVAVKGNVAVAGEPLSHGARRAALAPAPADHPVVARLRAAGAIVVGMTRMPELGVWGTSDGASGIARSPWAPDRSAGGSSGGSAAAVAAGIVPVAHGNDGLGSIRIPAAACGLIGIKPGPGVVPCDMGPTDWCGLVENGVLATTVEDAALTLSAMAARAELAHVAVPERPLRIGVSVRSPLAPLVGVDREYE